MKRHSVLLLALTVAAGALMGADGEDGAGGRLRFHAVFTDHMVFQRDRPVVLKGYSAAGAEVRAALGEARAVGTADGKGRWTLELPAMKAGGPHAVTVRSGNETATLKDVLVGEVWLCSGQSNMEMPVWNDNVAYRLTNGLEVAAAADDPDLRLAQINRTEGDKGPVEEPETDPRWWKGWQRAETAEAVKPFSATAYYFGKELRKRLGVPVGIVSSSWGGTQIRPWIGSERKDGYEPVRYNGMIAPLRGLQFRGVAWYQGCADVENWRKYGEWQRELVASWRETFGNPDLAFICVQLAGQLRNTPGKPFSAAEIAALEPSEGDIVNMRDVQAQLRDLPGCACVTAADIGDAHDVHAKNKRDVGARLAAAAENLCYGGKNGVFGPKVKSVVRDGRAVVVRFDVPIVPRGGALGPQEFTLAGPDGKRVWARAKQVAPDAVRVEADGVGDPCVVDYGWNPYPPSMSVLNGEGFPAFPFRRHLAMLCIGTADLGKATPAVAPDVSSWHGANLLGLFNANPQKPDKRIRGKFEECYFRWFRDWGFNFARLPMDYRYFMATNDWQNLKTDGFRMVDEAVAWGRKYGVHVQLCIHRAPGYTVCWWDPERQHLQTDAEPQDAFIRIWCEFARRYRGIPNAELSFNLVNEPTGFTEAQFIDVFGRTVDAIRKVDPDRFVMLDGNECASKPVAHFYKVPLTGQAFRGYTPHAISHYKAWYVKQDLATEPTWPLSGDMAKRTAWNLERPETTLAKFAAPREAGYPVMIGEFGCYNKLRHETCLAWMEDCLRLWEKEGLGWAIWNVDGAFGFMDSDRTDVAYEDFEGHKLDRKMLDLLRRYAK